MHPAKSLHFAMTLAKLEHTVFCFFFYIYIHCEALAQSRLCATQGKVSIICHRSWLTTEKFLPLLCRILSCVSPRAGSSSSAVFLHTRQVMLLITHFPYIPPSLRDFSRIMQFKDGLMFKVPVLNLLRWLLIRIRLAVLLLPYSPDFYLYSAVLIV